MARLTRAEAQERNRARVLGAARTEFTERGFRDAKIDRIAERADLTRGAVYSNFPGKRALYFAVLAEDAERRLAAGDSAAGPGRTPAAALGAFARAWVARLPLVSDEGGAGPQLLAEVLADRPTRQAFAQLTRLDALLLGLALERLSGGTDRRVRVAQAVLTTLHGADRLAAAAPGFGEPFDLVRVCERLTDLDLDDGWDPPHLAYAPPAHPLDQPWRPPAAVDALTGEPAPLEEDGVVTVLGLHRLAAAEEAVRAAAPGETVTAVLVSGEPAELGSLARLTVANLRGCLCPAFPRAAWPRLRVVHDEDGALARATGLPAVGDTTETAVRVRAGRIVARADTRGAGHAAASAR